MTGIGEQLRRERMRQKLTLDDVMQRTKISLRSLEAIEAEKLDSLPGVVFTRNFVRLYAQTLNLDPEPFLTRLPRVDIENAPLPDPPVRTGRQSWDPRISAAIMSLVWIATAGVAGTGAWYYFNHYGQHLIKTVSAAPAPKAMPSNSGHPISPEPVASASGPSQAEPVPTTASVAVPGPAVPEVANNSRPVQVILTARESVWVQASADGSSAFVGTLRPNETRTIAADGQVKLLVGNAGGLDISLNGKALDPIGPKGETRTINLTAAGPEPARKNPPVSSPL